VPTRRKKDDFTVFREIKNVHLKAMLYILGDLLKQKGILAGGMLPMGRDENGNRIWGQSEQRRGLTQTDDRMTDSPFCT
jgi:hypothetical protein